MNLDALIPRHVAPSMSDRLYSHTLVIMRIKAKIVHSCLACDRLLIRNTRPQWNGVHRYIHYYQVINGVDDCA